MSNPREMLLRFGLGLTDSKQVPALELSEGTVNFYPSKDEQYLENYAGRTDWFNRTPAHNLGTPPPTNVDYTRLIVFRDGRGVEHVVFVQGNKLKVVEGNGYREIYSFIGVGFGGKFYPYLFIHEAKLIIVNMGDPVLMWDGIKNVHPLGVQESPLPPDVRVSPAPESEQDYTLAGTLKEGVWAWQNWWWPGDRPGNGPGFNSNAAGDDIVMGFYEVCIQFFDEYGNKGRVSPPSRVFEVPPTQEIDISSGAGALQKTSHFVVIDYYPPQVEDHIYGVLVGRTLSLNPDGGLGDHGVFHVESTREDCTYNRMTMRMSDGPLASRPLVDMTVNGPPQARIGCSWKQRVFLAGLEDENIVAYSDLVYFGQFRAENQYRANDHVKAVVPLGDRIAVITRSSTEVLYDTDSGLAILHQDFANGSVHGRSFVDVGDGTIFGLWESGFGFFDGEKHIYIPAPYYIQSLYMDDRFYVHGAIKVREWYLVTVRKDAITDKNNYILLYHFPTRRWFILEESVYDLCWWEGAFLGCDDSIYELFKGSYPKPARFVVRGLIPQDASPLTQRQLNSVRFLMEPSSTLPFDIDIEGDFNGLRATEVQSTSMPSKQVMANNTKPVAHWSDFYKYDDGHEWIAPRDFWIIPTLNRPVSGYSHTIGVSFPAGHLVRLKALGLTFGKDEVSAI